MIGVPVFEIPTTPPSIPGLRLKEAFERGLREKRPFYFSQKRVVEVQQGRGGEFEIGIDGANGKQTINSPGVILATGRFIGGGLTADRKHIRETIFNLPVFQPESRGEWHREDFFDRQGHPINQAGVEIDDHFRPISDQGRPAFQYFVCRRFDPGSSGLEKGEMRYRAGRGHGLRGG